MSEQTAAHRLGVVQAILGDADGVGVEVAAHHAALELAELREDADSAAAQIGEVRRILGARDDEGAEGAARRVMRDHAAEVASLRAERDALRGGAVKVRPGDVIDGDPSDVVAALGDLPEGAAVAGKHGLCVTRYGDGWSTMSAEWVASFRPLTIVSIPGDE